MWEIEVTDQFVEWWSTLSDDQREAVTDRVDVLADVDRILVGRSLIESTRRDIDDLYDEYLHELGKEGLI